MPYAPYNDFKYILELDDGEIPVLVAGFNRCFGHENPDEAFMRIQAKIWRTDCDYEATPFNLLPLADGFTVLDTLWDWEKQNKDGRAVRNGSLTVRGNDWKRIALFEFDDATLRVLRAQRDPSGTHIHELVLQPQTVRLD